MFMSQANEFPQSTTDERKSGKWSQMLPWPENAAKVVGIYAVSNQKPSYTIKWF
jgi:hypothetical protein